MSLPVTYLPEAEDDVAARHTYYEQQRAGLGDQFVEALREVVDRIRDNPQTYDGANLPFTFPPAIPSARRRESR